MPLLKTCSACKLQFPATSEFWHKHARQGLRSRCKRCACELAKEWYRSHPKKAKANHKRSSAKRSAQRAEKRRIKAETYIAPTHRNCNVCNQEFALTPEFWHLNKGKLSETCKECAKKRAAAWHLANRDRALATAKEFRDQNPKIIRERKLQYYLANRGSILAAQQAQRAANPEKHRANANQYRLANPEKVAAKKRADYLANPERVKQRAHEWMLANPELIKARTARRRAAMKNAPGEFTKEDIFQQFEKQSGLCFYCREDLKGTGSIDHYIPLSKGGTNYPSNIVLACWPCNNAKRAKLPSEFKPKSASA